jgi:hypothetical protein
MTDHHRTALRIAEEAEEAAAMCAVVALARIGRHGPDALPLTADERPLPLTVGTTRVRMEALTRDDLEAVLAVMLDRSHDLAAGAAALLGQLDRQGVTTVGEIVDPWAGPWEETR